jgi:putative endonuclease
MYYVYILSNTRNTVLYTGITNNLIRRLNEHKTHKAPHFTTKYNISKLVYYEQFPQVLDAIAREKQIKAGSRKKKDSLIQTLNPKWDDLTKSIL